MNAFYRKLTRFGSLVRSTSKARKEDISDYFVVLHPAHPVLKDPGKTRPELSFVENCPRAVKREVSGLWNQVFGDQ